jgi:voltage-gated potassium channel
MTDSADRGEQNGQARTRSERLELLHHLEAFLEPLLASLGLVFLAILLLDLSGVLESPEQDLWLDWAINVIWGIFVVDFLVRLVIAPEKRRYLKQNWLTLLSLAVPFLRPFRALQALTAIRSLSLIRLLAGVNQGMRALQRYTRGRQIAYAVALSLLVMLTGAVAIYFFDQDEPDASIATFGDALWWSATMITTINIDMDAVSPEARVIAILQRIFAVSVFGFVTASIASYLVGRSVEERATAVATDPTTELVRAEIAALRRENAALRDDVAAMRERIEQLGSRG